MLPEHFKFVEGFRSVSVGYVFSKYKSEKEAYESLKRMAPNFSESNYTDAVAAAIKLAELAKDTFSRFKPGDYTTIDYDGYLKAADEVIPNYGHHVKRGVLNSLIQRSVR